MGRTYDAIDERWTEWIGKQAMFFVATAPLAGDGHVNVSPKGPIGSLRVLDPHTVAYLDVFGSGTETIGHLRENGRIVVMLCAFEGPPRILRLHGRGEVLRPGDEAFDAVLAQAGFDDLGLPESRRAIIRVAVQRIADSCGYGVPLMSQEGAREHYPKSVAKALRTDGAEGYERTRTERSGRTLDGLPALEPEPQRLSST